MGTLYPFALICVGIHILLNIVISSSYCFIPPTILHKLESLSNMVKAFSESSWFLAQVFYSFNLWLEGRFFTKTSEKMNERNILSKMRKKYYKHKTSDINAKKILRSQRYICKFCFSNGCKLRKYQNHKLPDPHFNLQWLDSDFLWIYWSIYLIFYVYGDS